MCNQGSQDTQPLFSIDLHLRRNCPFGSRYRCIFGFYPSMIINANPSSTDLLVILSLHQAKIQKDRCVAEQCLLRTLFSHSNGSFGATHQTISIWMLALPCCQIWPCHLCTCSHTRYSTCEAKRLHFMRLIGLKVILWRRWWRLGDEIDMETWFR